MLFSVEPLLIFTEQPALLKSKVALSKPNELLSNVKVLPDTLAAVGDEGLPCTAGIFKLDNFCVSLSWDAESSANESALNAGSRVSQTTFKTACISPVPLVIASTTSCSGITRQY